MFDDIQCELNKLRDSVVREKVRQQNRIHDYSNLMNNILDATKTSNASVAIEVRSLIEKFNQL